MPWTDRLRARLPFPAQEARGRWVALACALFLFTALLLSIAAPEKRLSVYSVAANYSLTLVHRDGREYVGLLEVLEPLGRVTAKVDGSRWRLRYNNVEAEFLDGKTRAKVQSREADLGAMFVLENRRGLVPLGSLSSLLPRILGGPVSLHEEAGRLLIGNIATHFTAPVNPAIATEPGALRMTFSREPVVGPASPTLTFGSKVIPSATYTENNGAAIVIVTSTVPVMASFGNEGRTIVITSTSMPAQNAPPAGTAPSAVPETAQAPAPLPPPVPLPSQRRYFAVVDAGHGGEDHGETLSSSLLEKDVTLALAHSL